MCIVRNESSVRSSCEAVLNAMVGMNVVRAVKRIVRNRRRCQGIGLTAVGTSRVQRWKTVEASLEGNNERDVCRWEMMGGGVWV